MSAVLRPLDRIRARLRPPARTDPALDQQRPDLGRSYPERLAREFYFAWTQFDLDVNPGNPPPAWEQLRPENRASIQRAMRHLLDHNKIAVGKGL